jgi:hypothetical protein
MSIRSIQEGDLSDSQIEDYQYVDEIDKDFIFEQVNPSGQYNFSGALYLYWSINLSSDNIELEIRGQISGTSYGKETLDRNNTSAHFSFRTGTSRSMLFVNVTVDGNFDKRILEFSGSERRRHEGSMGPTRYYDKVILSTW